MSETVVPIRSFDDKVSLMHRRIGAMIEWEKKSEEQRNKMQVGIGQALLEVRAAVEAGEVGELADWWGWFEDNVRMISRRTAERYMQIANAPNPESKVVELRVKNTAQAQGYRQRLAQPKVPFASDQTQTEPKPLKPAVKISAAPKKYPSSPDDDRLIGIIMDAFRQLSWDGIVRLYKEITDLYHLWQKEGRP